MKSNGNGRTIHKQIYAHDHRCRNCGRILFRGLLMPGSSVRARCQRCGRMTVVAIDYNTTGVVSMTQITEEELESPLDT